MARVIGSSISRIAVRADRRHRSARRRAARLEERHDGSLRCCGRGAAAVTMPRHPRVHVAPPPPGRGAAADGARSGPSGGTQVIASGSPTSSGSPRSASSSTTTSSRPSSTGSRPPPTTRRLARRAGGEDDRRRGDVRGRRRRPRASRSRSRWPRRTTTTSRCPTCGSGSPSGRCSSGRATCSGRPSTSPAASSSIAYAGSVVVSGDVHDALEEHDGLRWKSLRTRYLKDIGRVQLLGRAAGGRRLRPGGPVRAGPAAAEHDPRQGGRDDRWRSEPAEASVAEGGNGERGGVDTRHDPCRPPDPELHLPRRRAATSSSSGSPTSPSRPRTRASTP